MYVFLFNIEINWTQFRCVQNVTYSKSMSKIGSVCWTQSVSVTHGLCPSQTASACQRWCVFVQDNLLKKVSVHVALSLYLSHPVCVYNRQSISATDSMCLPAMVDASVDNILFFITDTLHPSQTVSSCQRQSVPVSNTHPEYFWPASWFIYTYLL